MKVVPISCYPPSVLVLVTEQIKKEMVECFAVPKHLLEPRKPRTAREVFLLMAQSENKH